MKENLYILWTNKEEITSEKMVMMYATNAMRYAWWTNITVIIWGGPNELIKESESIKALIKEAQNEGVKFSACKACADELGTTELLQDLGIEVIYWGDGLTKILKDEDALLTV